MRLVARALGVDYGTVRIGLAISDELGMLAHPLQTLDAQSPAAPRDLLRLAAEKGVKTVVIGLPRHMNGSEGASAEAARAFADKLRQEAADAGVPDLEVFLEDERLSTVAATRAFHESGQNSRKQRGRIDQGAAQIILQTWLDRKAMQAAFSSQQ
jgi:putative Holliday junction resolvase